MLRQLQQEETGKKYHLILGHSRLQLKQGYLSQIIANVCIVQRHTYFADTNTNCINILCGSVIDDTLTKEDAVEEIRRPFEEAKRDPYSGLKCIEIYYSGHGANGDWCLSKDGRFTLRDIMLIAKEYRHQFNRLNLVSQACKSGSWCTQLELWRHCFNFEVNIYASAWPKRVSWGNVDGSFWTRFMYGQNEITDPKREEDELRWTRASLTKEGRYTMARMNAMENVEAEVQSIPGKMTEIKSMVNQIEEHKERSNHLISNSGWFARFWSESIRSELYRCEATLDSLASKLCSLRTEINRIQGLSYLKSAEVSNKLKRYLTWALIREREMQVRAQGIIQYLFGG